ncbi:phosphoribosyltransferase, partial [Listeria monocytogenes]|nr:phosphoribosyltransferase [Listeria monocytogenes]
HKPTEEEDIKTIFATNLKADESTRNQRILLLLLFHLMNEITTNKDFEEVDFWGTFPSSDPENTDTAISFIKEAVRKIVNGKPTSGPEILIRKSPMNSKHSSRIQLRLTNKSNKDFETLIINPQLINEIKGKVICIIDDYITNGYSAEAAKHLLLNAGARKVIFISMGKFGGKYYSTDYDIDGDLSGSYSYKFCKETCWDGKGSYNPNSDVYILNFKDIIN